MYQHTVLTKHQQHLWWYQQRWLVAVSMAVVLNIFEFIVIGTGDGDVEVCDAVIKPCIKQYPQVNKTISTPAQLLPLYQPYYNLPFPHLYPLLHPLSLSLSICPSVRPSIQLSLSLSIHPYINPSIISDKKILECTVPVLCWPNRADKGKHWLWYQAAVWLHWMSVRMEAATSYLLLGDDVVICFQIWLATCHEVRWKIGERKSLE